MIGRGRRSRVTAAVPSILGIALAAGACWGTLPPPVDPSSLPPCSAGSYGVLGTDACVTDDDCAVCTSADGLDVAVARARLSALGARCGDGPATSDVACCARRCTLVGSGVYF